MSYLDLRNMVLACVLLLSPLPVSAADDVYCAEYAATAVAQNRQQFRQGCGYGPPVWSGDPESHRSWCIRVSQPDAEAGTRLRVDGLRRCLPANTPAFGEDRRCARYALLSANQQAENVAKGCRSTGAEWSGNPVDHYRWCVGVPEDASKDALDARRILLARCGDNIDGTVSVTAREHHRVVLSRSAFAFGSEALTLDRDRDGLVDMAENHLADAFRPMLVFDSDEAHRRPSGPLVLFQVLPRPSPLGIPVLRLHYALVFPSDAYGPDAGIGCDLGSGSHTGDVETMSFDIRGDGAAKDWRLVDVAVATWHPGPSWPGRAMQVHDRTHPVVYLSASKHHLYLDTSRNHDDSLYSDPPWPFDECNDDVNGRGAQVLADLRSIGQTTAYGFNNVGEKLDHDPTYFVNALAPFYPSHRVWDGPSFFQHGDLGRNFLTPERGKPQPLLLPQTYGEMRGRAIPPQPPQAVPLPDVGRPVISPETLRSIRPVEPFQMLDSDAVIVAPTARDNDH